MASSSRAGAVDPDDPQEQLLAALFCDDIVTFERLLNDARVDPRHLYTQPTQGTCLDVAAEIGRHVFVSALLKRLGTEPLRRPIRPPAELLAARGGHAQALAALLAGGGSSTAQDQYGRTALHYACYYAAKSNMTGYEKCVKIILQNFSVDGLNRKDKFGYTAIHLTAINDVEGFTDDGIQGVASNADGSNEEHKWLAKRRIAELILQLNEDVIDLDSPNARGSTARQTLAQRFPGIGPRLPLRTDSVSDPHKCLIEAVNRGQIDIFRALLYKSDANHNSILDPNHWFNAPINATVLELACSRTGGEEFVRVLLDCGADPDVPSKWNFKFPIHTACERGDPEVLRALVSHETAKVDLNSTDAWGNTALHYLARSEHGDTADYMGKGNFSGCLDILLKHDDLFVNRVNDNGETPLHVALASDNRSFVEELVGRKFERINLDILDCKKNLRNWITECYPDIKIPVGAPNRGSLCFADPEEIKLLELLKKRRQDEVVEFLRERPMHATAEGDLQNTPLQYAARFGMHRAAQALLFAGADPNGLAPTNATPPIVLACYYGHRDVLRELLETEARTPIFVNITDDKGNSALHYAAQRQDLESVILLLEHGAKWNQKNFLGRRPFDGCLKELLDKCITTNGTPPHSSNHEVIFDYRLFTSASIATHVPQSRHLSGASLENLLNVGIQDRRIRSEMQFFPILLHYSKGPELLNHPVTASFMHLKWSRIRWITFYNVINLIQYLFILNFHIVQNGQSEPYIKESIVPASFGPHETRMFLPQPVVPLPLSFWPVFTMTLWFFFQELFHCIIGFSVYRRNPENIINMVTYIVALVVIVPPAFVEHYVVQRWLYVVAIMFSCGSMFLLTGRIRQFAKNIEMLKVVLKRYILTTISYVIIVIAFALSFHIAFRHIPMPAEAGADRFQNMPYTFVKMLTMMVGELDSAGIPLERTTTGTLLFVVFVLGVTVVLQNLLVGLAVSDLETIHSDAERRWLTMRVRTIMDTETKLVSLHNSLCVHIPRTCVRCFAAIFWRGPLFPRADAPRRDATLVPGGPAKLRLSSGDSNERRPLEAKIVRAATDVLRLRNEQILLLQTGSAGTVAVAAPKPCTRSLSWLGGESAC